MSQVIDTLNETVNTAHGFVAAASEALRQAIIADASYQVGDIIEVCINCPSWGTWSRAIVKEVVPQPPCSAGPCDPMVYYRVALLDSEGVESETVNDVWPTIR